MPYLCETAAYSKTGPAHQHSLLSQPGLPVQPLAQPREHRLRVRRPLPPAAAARRARERGDRRADRRHLLLEHGRHLADLGRRVVEERALARELAKP